MKQIVPIFPEREMPCFLVKKAFPKAFCESIIETHKPFFRKADTHYPTSYRNNERQIKQDEQLSAALFAEIKTHIPERLQTKGIGQYEKGEWKLSGLNEKMRVCRYLPNQYFNKHLDGVHHVSPTVQSKLTFMIYLNGAEDFEGGKTLFFNSKEDDTVIASYIPEQGDLIIFDHNLWHSGDIVTSGEKYILRSDILYQKTDAPDVPQKAFCAEGHLGYIWSSGQLGDYMLTAGRDRKIKTWTLSGQKQAESIAHENSIVQLLALEDTMLLSASRDYTIKIWQVEAGQLQQRCKIKAHQGVVLCLCADGQGGFYSGGADGYIRQWNSAGELQQEIKAHDNWVWSLALQGKTLLSISENGELKQWSAGKEMQCRKFDCPLTAITGTDRQIIIGTFEGSIKVLTKDLEIKQTVRAHKGIIRRIKTTDQYLLTASEDGFVKVWDKGRLKAIAAFQHRNFVQDILPLKDSIISVAYDGQILKNKMP